MSYHLLLDAALPTEELEKALPFLIPMLVAAAAAALVIVLAVRKKKRQNCRMNRRTDLNEQAR